MATKTTNTPNANDITKAAEGTTKWGVTNLTFKFATAAENATITAFIATIGQPAASVTVLDSTNATDKWNQALRFAMADASRFSNLVFTEAATFADADLKFAGIQGATFGGRMEFPGDDQKSSATDFESIGLFVTDTTIGNQATETGASNFRNRVAIHELGHGLGLGHPHDDGNGTTIIADATSDAAGQPSKTDDPLDNERYTVESYERGGIDSNYARTFGHAASYSPIDIAALQHMYGAKANVNNGDTSYKLVDSGSAAFDNDGSDGTAQIGRALFTIWDTGGTDTIEYGGAKRAYINLNDASLDRTDDADTLAWIKDVKRSDAYINMPAALNEIKNDIANSAYHAGGFYSHVFTDGAVDLGGFAIANGVRLENAKGGSGDDILIGNEFNNELTGNGGKDMLAGSSGDDTLKGDAGDDQLIGGKGFDVILGGEGNDTAIFSGICADYDITKDKDTGVITVAHLRGDKIDDTDFLFGVEKAKFLNGDVDLTVEKPGCPPIDFIFLVDLSGSYSDDLPNFKASVGGIAAAVRDFDPNARFALSSFVDLPDGTHGATGDYTYKPEQALTDDIAAFQTAVNGLTIFNGWDYPEAQMVGLYESAKGVGLNLRENSQKIILIATDAPAHSAADYGLTEATIQKFLDDNGIIVGGPPSSSAATDAAAATAPTDDEGPPPIIPGPDDTGNGFVPPSPDGDPLLAAVKSIMDATGARPIFGVTGGVTGYYEGLETMFGRGSTVRIDGSSTNIADALRLALAELQHTITQAGDDFDNTLIGSDTVQDNIVGAGGNDRIEGRDLGDTLDGSAGNDTILGEGGNDRLIGGTGNDYLDGGAGDDTLTGGPGTDGIFGGAGSDTVDYSVNGPEQGVTVFLSLKGAFDGFGTVDGFDSVENVTGGEGKDVLVGDGGANVIRGNGDQDFLFSNDFGGDGKMLAGAGNDTLEGGGGNDGLFGGDGNDTMRGGDGTDALVGAEGNDVMDGGAGNDFLFGGSFGAGGSFAAGSGADTMNGGDGNDAIYGFDGADSINGDAGDDYIEANEGDDNASGGAGNDYVLGQDGNDTINGGTGFDYMYGAAGADTFVFRLGDSADWILDFKAAEGDKLRFEGFGFGSFAAVPLVDLTTPGNPAVQLTFTGAGGTDQLTVFGVSLAELNATNVLVA